MKKLLIIFLAASLALLFSCKKDKVNEVTLTETSYPDFSKLKAGNYWVYQLFDVDPIGNATPENKFDSCFIEKDTLIKNQTYFKFCKKWSLFPTPITFIRDSLHYVVDQHGTILFSSQDFSTILRTTYSFYDPGDTLCSNSFKMDEKNAVISTPYGSFTTYDYKETCTIYPDHVANTNKRYYHTRYAEHIGIVVETIAAFIGSEATVERRLVRYHVN